MDLFNFFFFGVVPAIGFQILLSIPSLSTYISFFPLFVTLLYVFLLSMDVSTKNYMFDRYAQQYFDVF